MSDFCNFDNYPLSDRNGTYGGQAGSKEGILIDGEYWLIKYPKSTKGMKGELDSYTTSPLSEYIGSHIYSILGFDVHETRLGVRNKKVVVACKDFCKKEGSLREIRTIKNIYNQELNDKLDASLSSTSDSRIIPLEDLMIHFKYNPVLVTTPGVEQRFWEQMIIDTLINNNDRNNGNWGLLYDGRNLSLAPVYDNGAAFANKMSENKIEDLLNNEKVLEQNFSSARTAFSLNGNVLWCSKLTEIEDPNFYQVAYSLIPKIKEYLQVILSFIDGIPSEIDGRSVCSSQRKIFYKKGIQYRLEHFLNPVYLEAVKRIENLRNNNIVRDLTD